jgi:integral membrane protein (TIGR01906 family)
VLAIPIALIATNVRFAASEVRVYDYSVREFNAAEASGIPESELMRANRELVAYLTDESVAPLHIVVTNEAGEQEALFNARETVHMADVRDLFQALFSLQVLAIAAALTAVVLLMALVPLRTVAQALLSGALLTGALVLATAVLASVGFDGAWHRLHLFAFTNDLWLLDPASDHLIQMFPRDFWFEATLLIGGMTMLEAVLIGAAAALYLYLTPEVGPALPPHPDFGRRSLEPRPRVPPPRPRHVAH